MHNTFENTKAHSFKEVSFFKKPSFSNSSCSTSFKTSIHYPFKRMYASTLWQTFQGLLRNLCIIFSNLEVAAVLHYLLKLPKF